MICPAKLHDSQNNLDKSLYKQVKKKCFDKALFQISAQQLCAISFDRTSSHHVSVTLLSGVN